MGIVNANDDSFYDRGAACGNRGRDDTRSRADRGGRRHHRRRWADGAARGGGAPPRSRSIGYGRSCRRSPHSACRSRSTPTVPRWPTRRSPPVPCSSTTTPASGMPSFPASPRGTASGSSARTTAGEPRSNRSRSYAVSVDEVETELRARREQALAAGVGEDSLLLDPCFGFGKDTASDVALVAALPRLRALGTPLLAACSHKEFTADATGLDESDLRGTLAAAVLCALRRRRRRAAARRRARSCRRCGSPTRCDSRLPGRRSRAGPRHLRHARGRRTPPAAARRRCSGGPRARTRSCTAAI